MAVSQMKLVTIVGPLLEFDQVVRSCIIGREFHPESTLSVMKRVNGLHPFDLQNPFAEFVRHAELISDRTGVALDYGDFDKQALDTLEVKRFFKEFDQKYNSLIDELERLRGRVNENEQVLSQIGHLEDVSVPLQEFSHFRFVKFRFGRLPTDVYGSFKNSILNRQDIYFFATSEERDYVYGMYLTPRANAENVDSLLASLQFERIILSDRIFGTAVEAEAFIRNDTMQSRERIQVLDNELRVLKDTEAKKFLSYYSYVRYMNDSWGIRQFAGHTLESFYILGWVPVDKYDDFVAGIDAYRSLNFVVVSEDANTLVDYTPPVKLKNNKLFKPFEPFVSMYGLPSYNEIDPTPLMAITYSILFGIMFGDLGQGAILVLVGFLMWKMKGMWLGRVISYAGVASMLFGGLVFGSVFGYEEWEAVFNFKPLHDTDQLLLYSVYGGAALITIALIFNIINGIRQKNAEKKFFGSNSIAGLVLYWGIVMVVLPFLGFGKFDVPPVLLLLGIFCPLILVFLREPLSHMAEKRGKWKPHGTTSDFIMSNAFEMIEVFLSYITNTLSFLRVGAYAISHASIMGVIYALAKPHDAPHSFSSILVIIFGNLIVIGIEGLLVGIQVLRLDFYEMFGRFYGGEGRQFEPMQVNYKQRKG